MKNHISRLFAAIIALTAIDQLIKYIINSFFFQTMFEIIPGVLAFKPVQNTDMSFLGSLGFKIFANYYVAIIFNLIIFVVAIILYKYIYVNIELRGKLTQTIFLFLFAGIICSTIDRIFWKGTIDYIKLEGLFTFDVKDCYISIYSILFIISAFRYQEEWKKFSIKKLIFDLCGKTDTST